ncbi:MAG: TrkH family potassium uptake protein [Chlamydiales bacterium]|nr:TrkH family potassium uptake protein [Chlamydiia bacterium]MCP5507984.1 TrkH family potassium uptake protein [Chlamydiales bacterium]
MLWRIIAKILAFFFLGLTGALLIPFLIALYYQFFSDAAAHPQPHTTLAFLESMVISAIIGSGLYIAGRHTRGELYRREGIALVVIIWLITPAVAALPFYLSGTLQNPLQAYFEAVSGFSTTGATTMYPKKFNPETGQEVPIVRTIPGIHEKEYVFFGTIDPVRNAQTGAIEKEGIEAVSKALLFWRSMTQWLGGMGIIVLFVAVLPALGVGGKVLFHAEMPGPIKDSLTPRIKETATHLWKIYLGMSILEIAGLMLTNSRIDLYEAMTITFSTVSTGGFSIFNDSIGNFSDPTTDWIVIAFMFLGSVNFSLYFFLIMGKIYRLYDTELIIYIILLLLGCGFTAWYISGTEKLLLTGQTGIFTPHEAIRFATFQIVSAQTTTGFATVNYDIWPYAAQVIMLIVMYLGGMAGSTAGGIKIMRHFMLFRVAQYQVESIFRPETVRSFRLGQSEIDATAAIRVLSYFLIVVACAAIGTLLYTCDGIDPESAISLSSLMINNIGIGFRMAGPTESCAFLSNFGLCLSCFLMVLGRLEFFAVLAVLVPAFWKRHS